MIVQEKKILVTKIQRFSLHDGPGIRTTIFLKGCSVRCPWCCNPENLLNTQQYYVKDGVKEVYGVYYEVNYLYEEIMKDEIFYTDSDVDYDIRNSSDISRLPGGITFSGGEPLLQMEPLQPLLYLLDQRHIHMAVETSLFVPWRDLCLAMEYINFFYIDVKILDQGLCEKYIGGDLELFFQNLYSLADTGKPMVIRIPVIGGYTEDSGNRKKMADLICDLLTRGNILKVELLKEHNLGLDKYRSLIVCNAGYSLPKYKGISDDVMELYRKELIDRIENRIPVEICRV